MCGFANRIAVLLVAGMLATGSAVRLAARQPYDSVGIAQRVLRATYPELKGSVTIGMDSDTDFDWRTAPLVGVTLRVLDASSSDHTRVALVAHLRISNGRLSSVLFSGSYVEQDLRAVVAFARRQNDTKERVIEELTKAGLKHLSDEKAFLEIADLRRLEPVLGKIQRADARFVAVPPIPTSVDYDYQPMWVVELQTIGNQNAVDCFLVNVEPVKFRLVHISRETCSR